MSNFTVGQINQLANSLELAGFRADDLTKLVQSKELVRILGVLRGTHEIAIKKLLLREVANVDHRLSGQQALEATGRRLYIYKDDVVSTMPRGNGNSNSNEVYFFKLGYIISDDRLEEEYASRGLVPCDPFTLAKLNQDDPEFADEYPNCTHWERGDSGVWAFATFDRWHGERYLYVNRRDYDWNDNWWFAGVRK